jgi:hypothetical protein
VRSVGVPGFALCPICGGARCISYWVFITPWCGMGFCNIVGGGCCTYYCGTCWGVAGTRGRGPFPHSFIRLKSVI